MIELFEKYPIPCITAILFILVLGLLAIAIFWSPKILIGFVLVLLLGALCLLGATIIHDIFLD